MEFWLGCIIAERGNDMCKINVEEKIAIYARVALHRNNNLEKQIDKIKKAVGGDCYNVYAEVASGLKTTREERGEWFRLLDDIERGTINSIYLTGYDRIARDYIFTETMLKKLERVGCEIHQII